MAVKLTRTIIQLGHQQGGGFSPACQQGDWQIAPVRLDWPRSDFDNTPLPRIIATPITFEDLPPTEKGATPVCVVREVSSDGFILASRNAASARGFCAFNWMAIREEFPHKPLSSDAALRVGQVPALRLGAVPPRSFAAADANGAEQNWDLPAPLPVSVLNTTSSAVLLTATDLNVCGARAAAIGLVKNLKNLSAGGESSILARNVGPVAGGCAFNWAAFPYDQAFDSATQPEPFVETGYVPGLGFSPSGQAEDTQSWEIYFNDPFLAAPLVLLTANNLLSGSLPGPDMQPFIGGTPAPQAASASNPAVLGSAQCVTPYGFKLVARNTDCSSGTTGFYWVALGWPPKS